MHTSDSNLPDGMSDNFIPDSGMGNTPPNMNNITGDMPGIQMPPESRSAGTVFDEAGYSSVEAACVPSSGETFDKNIKMSDLINQEDMTFEKFLSLIQN